MRIGPMLLDHQVGLNRTKVGLKQTVYNNIHLGFSSLNRTKVGLKRIKAVFPAFVSPRLNRTKVGLKHILHTPYIQS